MMAEERWWKALEMVALTSTKTNIVFGLHWPRETRANRWPRNELITRMVGEEAPHELMRDWGELPIHGGLRPDHRGGIRATHNLAGKEKGGKRCGRGHEGGIAGKDQKNSGTKYKVSDSGLSRGWLVVNPFGVTEPTVGWKRAPLSTIASNPMFF
jgi:hypothetical protein